MQKTKEIPDNIYDIVIIGSGPAGLTAGIYAARGRMNVLLIESLTIMGQAAMTDMVENYPGVEDIPGMKLVDVFRKQSEKFGLNFRYGTVEGISSRKEGGLEVWQVKDENGVCEALSVIIASGALPQKLGVPGEEEFTGTGVSYCATCDAAFFHGKDIIVAGGGDTAVEEALFLTRFVRKVTLVHRRDRLRATKVLQERAQANEKMEFAWDSVIKEVLGKEKVEAVRIKNVKNGEEHEIACDGVFVFVGWKPNTAYVKDMIKLDEKGGIVTDDDMKTSVRGIFAAGDCRRKLLHQIVTACGDGATAAFSAQRYVEELKGTAYK